MKLRRPMLVAAVLLLGAVIACDAIAAGKGGRPAGRSASHRGAAWHAGHAGHFHRAPVFIGMPFFAPLYFYAPLLPYYSLIPPIDLDLPLTAPQPGYWYYCPGPGVYYPAVTECPEGWQPVAPEPPS
jgi:hypothetical protein